MESIKLAERLRTSPSDREKIVKFLEEQLGAAAWRSLSMRSRRNTLPA